jgi:hypothetical protein
MTVSIHIELTTEVAWANNWVEYYAVITNLENGQQEPFEVVHDFFAPDGRVLSNAGIGHSDGLGPGESFTTDRFNVMPFEAGMHNLVIEVYVNGNVAGMNRHAFTVR